ncbi:uncharacterized protein F4817DRAFT_340564, partial [Daldinia loculata]|uniref:uncharacterized protein n=1 Tax=Daldinia loculata TaxID=103429 RepID=UPI0020C22798
MILMQHRKVSRRDIFAIFARHFVVSIFGLLTHSTLLAAMYNILLHAPQGFCCKHSLRHPGVPVDNICLPIQVDDFSEASSLHLSISRRNLSHNYSYRLYNACIMR